MLVNCSNITLTFPLMIHIGREIVFDLRLKIDHVVNRNNYCLQTSENAL